MKYIVILFVSLLSFAFAYTPETLDALLNTYVNDAGLVDYAAWSQNEEDVAALQGFVEELATYDPTSLNREEALAFWINTYNAIVLSEVLERYPTESIRPSFLGIPDTSFFIEKTHTVNGKTYSLDQIENNEIRTLDEPRIHFAINCASTSCPELRSEVYTPENLETQLNEQAVVFVNDPSRNSYDAATNTANLNKIFDWFEEDFGAEGVPSYIAQFAEGEAKTVLESDEVIVDYLVYDWGLNAQ